ncbi:MAG: hypothetical protein JW849_08320 [Phycisphaerae bacterium]|nr:hypothetical protein [Phycisphaerae bacterium]
MSRHEFMNGNPSLPFPSSSAQPRQVVVLDADTAQPVWRSHPLCDGRDSVRVDVWDGVFLGRCENGCLLPRGLYEAVFTDAAGASCGQASLQIAEKQIFSGDLTKTLDSWFGSEVEWRTDGAWRPGPEGATAENSRAFLFVDGAMHGRLQAEFFCKTTPAEDATWGLIARHYNAFAHLRVLFTYAEDKLNVRLVQMFNKPPDREAFSVLAETSLDFPAGQSVVAAWEMNGSRHNIALNGKPVLQADCDFMGGVTVMGLFADPQTVPFQRLAMTTTQPEATFTIRNDDYEAVIRPGNIHQLRLLHSGAPEQNLFWESGIQFGHIGASEIKFSPSARLDLLAEGPAVRQVRWRGPMPKFVERSDDVRGWSHGLASFYPDRIVIADYVTPWVRRSVGPDFDLLASVMNGPAKIAPAGKTEFLDWTLPADGSTKALPFKTCQEAFPLAAAFPYSLGGKTWWLIAVIGNLQNVESDAPASLFAWRDPHGLTASHDFRAAPTQPGTEYGFSITTTWMQSDDFQAVAQRALHLREEWLHPMNVEAASGRTVCYSRDRENPAEAIAFDGCFDRAIGAYVVEAQDGNLELKLDPGDIRRESVVFLIRHVSAKAALTCRLGEAELQRNEDYIEQAVDATTRMIVLQQPIDQPTVLRVEATRAAAVEAPPMPASDARVLHVDFENYADDVFGILDAGVIRANNPFAKGKEKEAAVLNDPKLAYRGNRCGYLCGESDQGGWIILQPRYDAPRIAGDEVADFMFRCVSDKPVELEKFIVWSARHIGSDERVGVILSANGSAAGGVYRLDVGDAEGTHTGAAVNLRQDEWIHVVLQRNPNQGRVYVWAGPVEQETFLGAFADLHPSLPAESIRLGDMYNNHSRGSGYWDDIRVGGILQPGDTLGPPETFRNAGQEKPDISYPVTVGEEKQLFVDDVMIESLLGVTRTQYALQKHPDNPIMVQERPWETQAGCILPMNLFRDEETGKLRLWYSCWGAQLGKPTLMCYAESTDGLGWVKPSLGIYSFEGSTDNNIIREGRMFRVWHDPADPDPSRRYKAAIRNYSGQFDAGYSSDGLRWRVAEPIMHQAQDASAVFWDHVEKKWIFSCKIFINGKRARGYAESRDFEHYTDTYPILVADEKDGSADELYGFSILRYQSAYVGLLKVYHTDTGLCDVQIAFSRNGKHWLREDRTPFIPNDPTEGVWDHGNIDDTGFPVQMGDELWFYYAGRSVTHDFKPNDGSMGLGTLRLDGFVSLDASAAGGVLTTQPVRLSGDTLYVNADVGGGEMQVEILDTTQRQSKVDEVDIPIAPFLKTDSIPITADGVRQAVIWKDQPSLKTLEQRPVRLRFHMKNAKLFSFWTEKDG